MENKFKKGEKARVASNVNEHDFVIGETIRIVSCINDKNYPYYIAESMDPENNISWAITDEELEDA